MFANTSLLEISILAFTLHAAPANNILIPKDYNISSNNEHHTIFELRGQKDKSNVETAIVGRWTSKNGKVHIRVDDNGRVIQQGQEVGTLIIPCCGNFGFRRRNEEAVYKYDNCIYWLYFSKNNRISVWYKLPDYKINKCPTGIFRRDEN